MNKFVALAAPLPILLGIWFLATKNSKPDASFKEGMNQAPLHENPSDELSKTELPQEEIPESEIPTVSDSSDDDSEDWWREPIYSSYQYNPDLAQDPEYRKLVTHHLYLDAFYKSPVRLEESFQRLLGFFKDWEVDPEQEIELLVQANNMAFQYHAMQRFYHNSTGIVSTASMRESAKFHRNFMINNLKETFTFLFDGYEHASFDELVKLEPSANFLPYSMKIEPGTRLISH